ncbi:MAG TPA: hypothetical protein VL181_11165 [Holophagaceae bacterium]|nr:hypothetical protein [Holophagaceae bacterium]
MKRIALILFCCSIGVFAGGATGKSREVTIAGKTYTVPMAGEDPLLVVTPEVRMERCEMLVAKALSSPGLDAFWGFNLQVRLKGRCRVEIFSPVEPGLVTHFEVEGPKWIKRMEFPYSACPELYTPIMDGTEESFMPFTVRVTPSAGGPTTELTQWVGLSPENKGYIQKKMHDFLGSRVNATTHP